MNAEEKFELITRNLEEVIEPDELRDLLVKKKSPSVYWGTMTTGSPHVAYFLPMIKLRDFLRAGLRVKVLIADLHGALDGVSWDVLEKREAYYAALFPKMLESLGVSSKNLSFVRGSDFQKKPNYFLDVLKMSMVVNSKGATKAASEVVKMGGNPKLGNLIYPIMQALDEEYLGADIQFGGLDQRKIFVFAREFLPKVGYNPRVELMNPMIAGLTGEKMSASVESSKIDILDDSGVVSKKIRKANFPPGSVDCGVMQWIKFLIFPMKDGGVVRVERSEKFGGNLDYECFDDLVKDVVSEKVHPLDLKMMVARELNQLLDLVRSDKNLVRLHKNAFSDS